MSLARWTGALLLAGLLCLGVGMLLRRSDSIVVVGVIFAGTALFISGSMLLVAMIGRWEPFKRG